MKNAVVVSAVRTPVGKRGGVLKEMKKTELAAVAINAAIDRAGIRGRDIDEVLFGSVTGPEYRNLARHMWLEAGQPIEVPALTINRACGTSLSGVAAAAAMIRGGLGETYLVGGVEMDSQLTYLITNEGQYKGGTPKLWRGYASPPFTGDPTMVQTAENVAKKYGITREECDEFALRSQTLATLGYEEGLYQEHIVPITLQTKNKPPVAINRDEILRPTTLESLAKLRPVLPGGVVTGGNASPLNDGASAAVIMDEDKAKAEGLKPLMRFVDAATVGLDPCYMGLGPALAIPKLLDRNKMTYSDVDFIEMNEAFAAQSLGVIRELNLNMEKLNLRGGAIALGHPYAATGINLVAKTAGLMKRRNSERCIVTFCCGGGQGVAVLFENC